MASDTSEKDLHKNLVKLLRFYQNNHNFLFFHIKNDVGKRRNNFFYDLKSLGVLPGVSDFCILTPGKTTFFEIKTRKGRLSPKQNIFKANVERLGHEFVVAYGWEEILKKVNRIILKKEEGT